MAKDKFALGIDYGTESGRAVVIRVRNGEEIASAVVPYPDGVIDERLPGGPRLEPDWALQNPRDYLLVAEKGVPKALKAARVKAEDVIGIGTDFTASTPLPVKRDGTPLCSLAPLPQAPARLGEALEAPCCAAGGEPDQRSGPGSERRVHSSLRRQVFFRVVLLQGPAGPE